MFDEDLTLLPTADLLESAADHRAFANRADARGLEHALVYADRFHPDAGASRPGRRSFEGRERPVVLGGEGCPEIMEFAISEYAVVLGVSHGIGAKIIGDALALRHRFPLTWARVLSGDATPWKACRIVRECVDLSEEAARFVDSRVAALIDTITPYRLDKIVKAAKMHADPEAAHAEAAAKVRERGVFVGRSNEHGTKTIYIRTSIGAAARFDAAIDALGDAQQSIGDTRSTQLRRAEAVGIIADPVFAQELLNQAHQHPHTPNPDTAPNTPAETAPTTDADPSPSAGAASTTDAANTPTTAASTPGADPNTPARATSTTDAANTPAAAASTTGAGSSTSAGAVSGMDVASTSAAGASTTGAGPSAPAAATSTTGAAAGAAATATSASTAGTLPAPTSNTPASPTSATPTSAPGAYAPEAPASEPAGRTPTTSSSVPTARDTSAPQGPGPHAVTSPPNVSTGNVSPPSAYPPCAATPGSLTPADVDDPGPDDEADRDAPHPSSSNLPDPMDRPDRPPYRLMEPFDPASCRLPDDGQPMDAAAQRALASRLAQIKHDAYARLASAATTDNPATPDDPATPDNPATSDDPAIPKAPASPGESAARGSTARSGSTARPRSAARSSRAEVRPGKTVIYVHLTDSTLAAAADAAAAGQDCDGVLRVEGNGPLLATQLGELIGYGPYIVKPVIDLNDAVSVNCYEATAPIRERVKLTHPVELFPYGTRETSGALDLDHLKPYDPLGPPGQTSTTNLIPLSRRAHRLKTHARGWTIHRLNATTLEWTTPHGFVFHVDRTGTHRIIEPDDQPCG
ncbi:hypothetical protein OG474_20720 [Kribbella sp. NBC_01505]|uniref:hypothetical protein n=1 Tax=Kribbella sp. NBC_01505 TaxID=2903580 RepID=UPI003865C9F2